MKREYSDIGGIQQQAADIIRQAYDKGYKQGIKDGNINDGTLAEKVNEAYSRGLNASWSCARKIVLEDDDYLSYVELEDIFKDSDPYRILETFSPSNAIARIKAYEEKQKLKVGDEVKYCNSDKNGEKGIVIGIYKDWISVKFSNDWRSTTIDYYDLERTGRRFPQIAEVLDQMKEGEQDGEDT